MATKLLINLLRADEYSFRQYIDGLEHVCLRPGVDIRLSAEIVTSVREKTRALGFDPKDTTTRELYHLLKARLESDDAALRMQLRLDGADPEKTAKILATNAHKLSKNERSLSLTNAGVKKLLKAVPPRKTMRLLRYRSLESVVKRTNPKLLYTLACLVEGKSWNSQVHAKMLRLATKDVQWQQVSCAPIPLDWYRKLSAHLDDKGAFISNNEVGSVFVAPVVDASIQGSTVLSLGLLLNAAQTVAINSVPYRKSAFDQGYMSILPELAHNVMPDLVSIHGLRPSWKIVHELMNKGVVGEQSPELEFIVGESSWQSVEMKLATLLPSMDFWVNSHYLGVDTQHKPISFHVMDLALDVATQSSFAEQSTTHFEASLWNELQLRYLQNDVLNHSLSRQLSATHDQYELSFD